MQRSEGRGDTYESVLLGLATTSFSMALLSLSGEWAPQRTESTCGGSDSGGASAERCSGTFRLGSPIGGVFPRLAGRSDSLDTGRDSLSGSRMKRSELL